MLHFHTNKFNYIMINIYMLRSQRDRLTSLLDTINYYNRLKELQKTEEKNIQKTEYNQSSKDKAI